MASEKNLNRYSAAHAVYNLHYHIVFCPKSKSFDFGHYPKYRRPVLETLESELRELFEQKAKELNVKIEAMEIMPDHVHLVVLASPAITPQLIVNQMKGYTSHVLRERHDWLRSRLPTLWTRSYYIGSAGVVSQETIMKYIESQNNV